MNPLFPHPIVIIQNTGRNIEEELYETCKKYTLKGGQKPIKENPYKVAGVILHE